MILNSSLYETEYVGTLVVVVADVDEPEPAP